jgi:transcriptional regulator GlxA family with amidase domain
VAGVKRRQAILATVASLTAGVLTRAVRSQAADAQTPQKLAPPNNGVVQVAVVVGKDATVIDFAGPWEVFQDSMSQSATMGFELFMVSDRRDTVKATAGMQIVPRYAYGDSKMPTPNVIVIGAQSEHTPAKIAWIRAASARADVTMSVCTGAFLLAQTGLLDSLRATTHHNYYDEFAARFPNVTLVRGPRYVENDGGRLCTAGGLASGFELALRVVERYFGEAEAQRTAYQMEYTRSSTRPPKPA